MSCPCQLFKTLLIRLHCLKISFHLKLELDTINWQSRWISSNHYKSIDNNVNSIVCDIAKSEVKKVREGELMLLSECDTLNGAYGMQNRSAPH